MKCRDCKFYTPSTGLLGDCTIEIPVWLPYATFSRQVSVETGCDWGQPSAPVVVVEAPRGRGRPRKQVVEVSDGLDE